MLIVLEFLKKHWKVAAVLVALVAAYLTGALTAKKETVEIKTVDEAKMSEIIAMEKEKMMLVFEEDYKRQLSEELQKNKSEKKQKVITIVERKKNGSTKETKIEEKSDSSSSESKSSKQVEEKKTAATETKEKESLKKETVKEEKKTTEAKIEKPAQASYMVGVEVSKPASTILSTMPQDELLYSVRGSARIGNLPLWGGMSYQFKTNAIGLSAQFEF